MSDRVPLSLDPATLTGWALTKPGLVKPRIGLVQMPDVERDIGWWGEAFLEWFVPFCRLEGVTDVVAEAPYIAVHHGPDGAKVNANEIEKLVSLFAFAALGCRQLGLPPLVRAPRSTVCVHFIAQKPDKDHKRKWIKTAMVLRCQQKGWNITSEDVADAAGTLDWFCWDRKIAAGWDCSPGAPMFEGGGVRIDNSNKAASSRLLNSALSFARERA